MLARPCGAEECFAAQCCLGNPAVTRPHSGAVLQTCERTQTQRRSATCPLRPHQAMQISAVTCALLLLHLFQRNTACNAHSRIADMGGDPDPEKERDMPASASPGDAEESDDDALDPLAAAKKTKQLARKGITFNPKESKVCASGCVAKESSV